MNRLRENHEDQDDGPGLHAARLQPHIIDTINACGEVNTFIPALAYTFSSNPVEIEVGTSSATGESKYSLYQPDPPELRPGHRLLDRAAAVVLGIGTVLSIGSAACS
jgi:undecaprenyl-phosphate 4-deoxy-4-formamido-L-arabinose transferase